MRLYETEKKGGTGLTTEDVKEAPLIDIKMEPSSPSIGKGIKRRSLSVTEGEEQEGTLRTPFFLLREI